MRAWAIALAWAGLGLRGLGWAEAKAAEAHCNRALPSSVEVKLGVFVDHALYARFYQLHPDEEAAAVRARVRHFVTAIVHNSQLVLDADPLQPRLQLVVTKLVAWRGGRRRADWAKFSRRKLNMAYYMQMFCAYQERMRRREVGAGGAEWDHALLFTGFDLSYLGRHKFSGYGTIRSLCTRDSCAVLEARNFKGAFTLLHELGHALGMTHDGVENSCPPSGHIMSAVVRTGHHSWSTCSRRELESFLRELLCSDALPPWCLKKAETRVRLDFSLLPGQRYTLEDQCRLYLGVCYQPYVQPNQERFSDVCREVWCSDGASFVNASHAALEGTWCGRQRVCEAGRCVRSERRLAATAGAWGPWRPLPATDSCGGPVCSHCQLHGQLSVKRLLRSCDSPRSHNGGRGCGGERYAGLVCGEERCGASQSIRHFASTACQALMRDRTSHPEVGRFSGTGTQRRSSHLPCVVWCHLRNSSEIYTLFSQFPDGTPCGEERFCVAGLCLPRSCDGGRIGGGGAPCPDGSAAALTSPSPQPPLLKEDIFFPHLAQTVRLGRAQAKAETTAEPRKAQKSRQRRERERRQRRQQRRQLAGGRRLAEEKRSKAHAEKAEQRRVQELKKKEDEAKRRREEAAKLRITKATVKVKPPSMSKPRGKGEWGRWGAWSSCSKPCGRRAFRKRIRHCRLRGRRTSAKACLGRDRRYRMCTDLPAC